jgi:preprotein translocase subunit SecA
MFLCYYRKMSILTKVFKNEHQKTVAKHQKTVTAVGLLEESVANLSQEEMRAKTVEFKKLLSEGTDINTVLPEAFALVREASRRLRGERHHDVQLIGGMILHEGGIAEMRTGEGKTLVATLPAYLNGLTGKGVHIVTVNDYLSRRDGVWMGEIYNYLGLSVSVINHQESFIYDDSHTTKKEDSERDTEGSHHIVHEFLRPCTRKEAYAADITYGTNNEFGFDYLRDNIGYSIEQIVQRPFHYAIVDEVDSILIDEARTPLIMSAAFGDTADLYGTCAKVAEQLSPETHYIIDEKRKAIQLTDAGITRAEELLGITDMYTEAGIRFVHHMETAVRAKALFIKDKEYVLSNGEVIIVDEFTGRMQPGRRWSDGLHQAVEAKEGVKIQEESRTLASITFQNYFRFYEKLSGMTGTADTSAEEFLKVYSLPVTMVPTHNPIRRIDHNDQIYQTELGKWKAIARKVKELQTKGQPVLIGTVSIEKNELLSDFLKSEGVRHEVLNAKNHEREGEIIAQAGKKGGVVIATNMAGRGVDIKLGGAQPTKEEYEEVKELGGLFVLGTERHEARRIDNQLRGRSARQGDPGETQFFVSLEDDLMRVFASDTIKNMMGRFGIPEDEAIDSKLVSRSLENAQAKIEGLHFDSRKDVLQYDDVLNQQRRSIYEKRRKILYNDTDYLNSLVEDIAAADDESKNMVESAKKEVGEDDFMRAMRVIALEMIDTLWIDHLEAMDHLRSSVGLRSIGQRDPLVEYKREGLALFRSFDADFKSRVAGLLPRMGQIVQNLTGTIAPAYDPTQVIEIGGGEENKNIDDTSKVGRNDLCPCGSSKKYKKCHGK